MALTFEQIIAGAPPTGGDSGSEFARKINDNFAKLTGAIDASKVLLQTATATIFGLTGVNANVDNALAKIYQNKNKFSILGTGAALSDTTAMISFSQNVKDDFGAINVATYPTRLTIPASLNGTYVRFFIQFNTTGSGSYSIDLYKNGTLLGKFVAGTLPGGCYYYIPTSVATSDYYEVKYNDSANSPSAPSAGTIFGFEVI